MLRLLGPAIACKHPQCRSHLRLIVVDWAIYDAARDIDAYVIFAVFTFKPDCLILCSYLYAFTFILIT
jgi:hypothetical protein